MQHPYPTFSPWVSHARLDELQDGLVLRRRLLELLDEGDVVAFEQDLA
jgi:hypothetical protein